ncbi:hypothetical protein EON77_17160 [bacterium]|nr:MAG: hypothetical protein EON77_17160 [bacterium]
MLAGLVESATPSLLIMSTGPRVDHVVPLLGYTINTDEWHPSGAQVHLADKDGTASSSLWIDHLLLNDDQLGPYYCLSRAGLFEKSGHASAVTPQRVIAVLPEGAQVSPLRAELTARGGIRRLLSAMLSWHRGMELPRWLSLLAETRERRVFRTILVDRETYVGELRARPELGEDGPAIGRLEAVAAILPDRFWMVEVSLPNILLANRSRLGEILVAPSGETPRILLARMPGVIGALKDDDLDLSRFPMETYVPMHSSGENSNTW